MSLVWEELGGLTARAEGRNGGQLDEGSVDGSSVLWPGFLVTDGAGNEEPSNGAFFVAVVRADSGVPKLSAGLGVVDSGLIASRGAGLFREGNFGGCVRGCPDSFG